MGGVMRVRQLVPGPHQGFSAQGPRDMPPDGDARNAQGQRGHGTPRSDTFLRARRDQCVVGAGRGGGVCGREWAEWGWCGVGNGGGEIELKARDCEEAEIKKKKGTRSGG